MRSVRRSTWACSRLHAEVSLVPPFWASDSNPEDGRTLADFSFLIRRRFPERRFEPISVRPTIHREPNFEGAKWANAEYKCCWTGDATESQKLFAGDQLVQIVSHFPINLVRNILGCEQASRL